MQKYRRLNNKDGGKGEKVWYSYEQGIRKNLRGVLKPGVRNQGQSEGQF